MILHAGSSGGIISFRFPQNRLKGFRDVGSQNLPFPIPKASTGLYNSLFYRTSRDSYALTCHKVDSSQEYSNDSFYTSSTEHIRMTSAAAAAVSTSVMQQHGIQKRQLIAINIQQISGA